MFAHLTAFTAVIEIVWRLMKHFTLELFLSNFFVSEGILRLMSRKCGKTTRIALSKALECLACHSRVHQAVSAHHTFKGDRGHLESDALCTSILLCSLQTIDAKNLYFSNSELRSIETLSATLSQECMITLEYVVRGRSLMHA